MIDVRMVKHYYGAQRRIRSRQRGTPLRGARIVLRTVLHRREHTLNAVAQLTRLRPIARKDENLRSDAIKTRVMRLLRGNVFCLKLHVPRIPAAGNHNRRTDVSEFAGKRLSGSCSKGDRVVRALAARDVNLVDDRMRAQIFTDVCAAIGKPQKTALNERL